MASGDKDRQRLGPALYGQGQRRTDVTVVRWIFYRNWQIRETIEDASQ